MRKTHSDGGGCLGNAMDSSANPNAVPELVICFNQVYPGLAAIRRIATSFHDMKT